jgi:hypothetical protein
MRRAAKILPRRCGLALGAATMILFARHAVAAPPKPIAEYDAYGLVVLAARPAGYWRLGEAAGADVAVDASGNQRNGKYVGRPKLGSPGAIAGEADGSVTLDGASYVEIPDDPAFSQPTSGAGLTVEAWMRPDRLDFPQQGGFHYVHWLGKGEAGQQEWAFRFYSRGDHERPNRISAYIWNTDGQLGAGGYFQDAIVPGQWLHVAACYEPGDARFTQQPVGVQIYKNGVLRQGPPAKATLYYNPPRWNILPTHAGAPLRLGTRDRKGGLIGGLDEVAIYLRVLSAEELRLHYDLGVGARKLSHTDLTKLQRMVKSAR